MMDYEPELDASASISKGLATLPLFDDLFLRMQAMNLDIIDGFLVEQESALLAECMRTERTPVVAATFVSALSQMWMFGAYELLRTWRQRAGDVLRWAKDFRATPPAKQAARLAAKKQEIADRSAFSEGAIYHWPTYEMAASNAGFPGTLRLAVDRTERLFRRIEALRMSLAKHETRGIKGSFAMAPGYGRIDMSNGSLYWQVVLRGDEIDIISRREVADGCRQLANYNIHAILPERVQEKVRQFPDIGYGIKRIIVVLHDGTTYGGVIVAWAKEVLSVHGHSGMPFDAGHVVDARSDTGEGVAGAV